LGLAAFGDQPLSQIGDVAHQGATVSAGGALAPVMKATASDIE
jgi:hypothetical protein